ncbi:Protein-L-isoaspartate O-methyltransferase [Rosistilla carotiformis]|uniref:Protein-L-isoaspartate O-methyltransferase n=1 Tax=Rosistilla carotiformis TaxID=2528017 RepID=A0A518K0W2_9BACT|nr:protein-L-isoaspartate(D-aspartate) O-methyltransferase [Rosistilla carotiformis]QDV71438.1 Protein-L-isoaspartate O-methyltransferase [Rosistilla carotiformis]
MSLRLSLLLSLLVIAATAANGQDPYVEARKKLVQDRVATAGVTDPGVLRSIETTPRHQFIPRTLWDQAYYDMALPIGDSQTISSPFIVAHMTEVLQCKPDDVVLEIGTGSGYQAAVLSPLVKHVYTIEIVEPLGIKAAATLKRLGYKNVSAKVGDGFLGWPEAAPFDKIIVTCSPESVPQPLVDQLKEGGRMVIPVGERYQQTLYLMEKKDGKIVRQSLRPTLFVPMTGTAEDGRLKQPDGENPEVVNGSFDAASDDPEQVPGWYYGRQFALTPDPASAGNFVRFQNETAGRDSHLLQGLALDGRAIPRVRLAGKVRTQNIDNRGRPDQLPVVAVSFYDEKRRELGTFWIGPFTGTHDWTEHQRSFRVPPTTREAIVRIGLFGAVGTIDFDDVTLTPEL